MTNREKFIEKINSEELQPFLLVPDRIRERTSMDGWVILSFMVNKVTFRYPSVVLKSKATKMKKEICLIYNAIVRNKFPNTKLKQLTVRGRTTTILGLKESLQEILLPIRPITLDKIKAYPAGGNRYRIIYYRCRKQFRLPKSVSEKDVESKRNYLLQIVNTEIAKKQKKKDLIRIKTGIKRTRKEFINYITKFDLPEKFVHLDKIKANIENTKTEKYRLVFRYNNSNIYYHGLIHKEKLLEERLNFVSLLNKEISRRNLMQNG